MKYNTKDERSRKLLANTLLATLLSRGFSISNDYGPGQYKYLFTKFVTPRIEVCVDPSIGKWKNRLLNSSIRVYARYNHGGVDDVTQYHPSTLDDHYRVNRRGLISGIALRMMERVAVLEAWIPTMSTCRGCGAVEAVPHANVMILYGSAPTCVEHCTYSIRKS